MLYTKHRTLPPYNNCSPTNSSELRLQQMVEMYSPWELLDRENKGWISSFHGNNFSEKQMLIFRHNQGQIISFLFEQSKRSQNTLCLLCRWWRERSEESRQRSIRRNFFLKNGMPHQVRGVAPRKNRSLHGWSCTMAVVLATMPPFII